MASLSLRPTFPSSRLSRFLQYRERVYGEQKPRQPYSRKRSFSSNALGEISPVIDFSIKGWFL